MTTITQFQVDTFTDKVFGGNPAAVCPLEAWLPDETLARIARENNLAETAYFVTVAGGYHLRWFTLQSKLICAVTPRWRQFTSCSRN